MFYVFILCWNNLPSTSTGNLFEINLQMHGTSGLNGYLQHIY